MSRELTLQQAAIAALEDGRRHPVPRRSPQSIRRDGLHHTPGTRHLSARDGSQQGPMISPGLDVGNSPTQIKQGSPPNSPAVHVTACPGVKTLTCSLTALRPSNHRSLDAAPRASTNAGHRSGQEADRNDVRRGFHEVLTAEPDRAGRSCNLLLWDDKCVTIRTADLRDCPCGAALR